MSKHYLFSIFTFVLLLFLITRVTAQENLLLYTTKVSINVQNKKLREVLDELEKKNNLTFSYKSGLINETKPVTVKFENYPLYNVLDSIISIDSLEFYPLGRQVVIYKPTSGAKTKKIVVRDTLEQVVLRKDTVQVRVLKRDTVFLVKTDTLYDSVFVKDPYPVFDTIFMDKPKIEYSVLYSLNRVTFNRTIKESGFPLLDVRNNIDAKDLFNASESKSGSLNRFVLMAKVNLNNSVYAKIGAGISIKKWKVGYDFTSIYVDSSRVTGYNGEPTPIYEVTQQVFFEELGLWVPTDSVITAYDYSKLSPVYGLKSVYQKYYGVNRIVYFTLPVYIGFEKNISKNSILLFESGLIMDFVISQKGKSLNNRQYAQLAELQDIPMASINSYITFNAGYKRKISDNLSAFALINYAVQINQSYHTTYPIKQRLSTFGISLGVEF